MARPVLSFIIPTLNEENVLPLHLAQYRNLHIPHEVIVADGGSLDKTRDIAREHGALVYLNKGKQTIGSNRNIGAAHASANIYIFCDADTRFDGINNFAMEVVEAFKDPEVVAGMPRIRVFPEQRIGADKVYHYFYNNAIRLSFRTPMALGSGQCQIVRASTFRGIGGYPHDQIHGEDSTLFRELKKRGRLVYFVNQTILESPRRYRHYGYLKFLSISTSSLVGQSLLKRNILKEWKRVG